MWSAPLVEEESTVVSEIGEQWSPKIPPESTAPSTSGRFAPVVNATGIAIGNMIP